VFYTSLGHREDIWTNPFFQAIVLGGFAWAMGDKQFDVKPNIEQVTPKANQLKN
jgi:type 1 glutamine amidotransferase